MSEEHDNHDDGSVTLQYLTLRTNLINGLTALLQEYHTVAEHIPDRNFPEDLLDKDMNFIADRKAYLLDIAKQGLTSDDYAHFKDLMDEFRIGYWRKHGIWKKVTKKY